MDNLIFSLNAILPIFFTMLLGSFFKRVGLIDEAFSAKMNKFAFAVALPALLFQDISAVDIRESWNGGFVLFCFIATFLSITGVTVLSFFVVKREERGEFVQGAYRSSAAILGIAFIQNIYGNSGQAPLMIIGSVPLYNIMAVVVLSFFKPGQNGMDKALLKKTLTGIITNPIIIGIAAGLLWSALKLPMPVILHKAVSSIGGVATPMGLMAMGATFDIKKAFGKIKPTVIAAFIKLVGFVAVFMPLAVVIGFRREKLIAILVMLGSATTVSSYVMAKNMGHEGVVSSSVVMLTTMCSAFTLTGWLFIMKCFGLV